MSNERAERKNAEQLQRALADTRAFHAVQDGRVVAQPSGDLDALRTERAELLVQMARIENEFPDVAEVCELEELAALPDPRPE